MYRVILVDDEHLITMALEKMITGSDQTFQVVGTFDNGKDALDFMMESPVDIALVDICMPVMNGLELMRQIRDRQLPARMIVLSAYRDFQYAHEALVCGASDYILKPISQEQLMATLQNVAQKIKRDYELEKASAVYSLNQTKTALKNLIKNKPYAAEYLPDSFLVLQAGTLLLLSSPDEFPEPFQEECMALGWLPFRANQMLCYLPDQEADMDTQKVLAGQTRKLMAPYFIDILSVSVSQPSIPRNRLSQAVHQCRAAAAFHFYFPDRELLFHRDISPYLNASVGSSMDLYKELLLLVQTGRMDLVSRQLGKFFLEVQKRKTLMPHLLRQLMCDFIQELQIQSCTDSRQEKDSACLQSLLQADTLDTLMSDTESLLGQILSGKQREPITHEVEQVKEFCIENYAEDIGLDDIAAEFYITKNHLSRIFKEQCGISIWNYFTDLRINKARELLSGTEIKVNKIGEMVGYKNASYFGVVFRNRIGLPPMDYRLECHAHSGGAPV